MSSELELIMEKRIYKEGIGVVTWKGHRICD